MSWSENGGSQGPVGADIGIAFSGWSEAYQALASGAYSENLHGQKYLTIGGANVNGHLSVEILKKFHDDIGYIKDAGFAGVLQKRPWYQKHDEFRDFELVLICTSV